jgi:hypothetical protein
MKKLNEYEQEMYKFLSERNNFENMLLVLDNFDMVKRNLLEEFWYGVKAKVEVGMDVKSGDWKLSMNEYTNPWWTMTLTKIKWPHTKGAGWDVAINWGHMNQDPHFGVWIHNDTRTLKLSSAHLEIKELAPVLNGKQQTVQFFTQDALPWWPLVYQSEHNFAEKSALLAILPSEREPLIEHYANMMIALATSISADLDAIVERNRI